MRAFRLLEGWAPGARAVRALTWPAARAIASADADGRCFAAARARPAGRSAGDRRAAEEPGGVAGAVRRWSAWAAGMRSTGARRWFGLDDATFAGAGSCARSPRCCSPWSACGRLADRGDGGDPVLRRRSGRRRSRRGTIRKPPRRARDLPVREQFSTSLERRAARAAGQPRGAAVRARCCWSPGSARRCCSWRSTRSLIGRELQDMVWLRHRRDAADPAPLGARRAASCSAAWSRRCSRCRSSTCSRRCSARRRRPT